MLERLAGCQILNLKNNITDFAIYLREHVANLTSYHHLYNLVHVEVCCAVCADVLTVTEYADVITDAEDFFHFMRNVDDCNVLGLQIRDNIEQMLYFRLGQSGSRLVHDYDLCIVRYSLCNFYHLLLSYRQISHHIVRIQRQIPLFKQFFCFLACPLVVTHQLVLHREAAKPQVFAYGTIRYRRQLLMDHGNACVHRLQWTLKLHFLAVEDNLARGARLNADQTLHQCRFTCTVFTH